jgi:ATP-binding cassette subfamily C (CFTR/MRP) protein 1
MSSEVLARVTGGFFRTMAGVVGMVAVISSSAPSFLLVVAPLLLVYKRIQSYVPCSLCVVPR